jgi:HPt (histidine-containing phosphotransfer) domain-containing protein
MTALREHHAAEDLRSYFAYRLPARVSEIEAARDAARDAGWTGEPFRTFHRLAHSLTGAGATFGFPEVTAAARELEGLLKGALDGAPLPEDEVEGLLSRLRDLAERPLEPTAEASVERAPATGG